MTQAIDAATTLKLWDTLSQLFLDTELQPLDYRYIAGVIRDSGIPPESVLALLENDIAPTLMPNLWSVAGNWSGWTDQSLRAFAEEAAAKSASPSIAWKARRASAAGVVKAEWPKIMHHLSNPEA